MGLGRAKGPIFASLVLVVGLCSADSPRAAGAQTFLETFTGAPPVPTPWHPANWDVTVHSRDVPTLTTLETMHAGHGTDCSAPPASHDISSYQDAVFLCRDHMMTAIKADGYGVIYVTPNQLVDFSAGEAVVRFDMSTARTSLRDWIDLWITPFDDNVQLVGDIGAVDLNGFPRRAIQIRMDAFNNRTVFRGSVIRDFSDQRVGSDDFLNIETILTPSAAVRTTFELRVSRTHLKFGIPELDAWWVDNAFADLGWDTGVLQIGHHSYNPEKGDGCGPPPCAANTWHWDNVSISPAIPFTMLNADRRSVSASGSPTLQFAGPAPANARLRFTGIGTNLGVSFDGGSTWQTPQLQAFEQLLGAEHFRSYWTPVPTGTQSVQFRGSSWFGGPWLVRNVAIWASATSSSPLPTFAPSAAPTVNPTVAPSAAPTAAPTPSASASAPPGGGGGGGAPAPTPPPVAVIAPQAPSGFHSAWTSQSAYPVLAPGGAGLVTMRFTNTGREAWQVGVAGRQVNLGVTGDSTEFADLGMAVGWPSANRVATTQESFVAPGAIGTFTFLVRAPLTPGVYRLPLAPVADGVAWLEDQGVFVAVTSDTGFHSVWRSQSAWPLLRPGQVSGPLTLVFRNSGAQPWIRGVEGSQVNLGIVGDDRAQGALGVDWLSADRPAAQGEQVVVPGALGTFTFRVRAPEDPGTYRLSLQLVADGVTWLEDEGVFIEVSVIP